MLIVKKIQKSVFEGTKLEKIVLRNLSKFNASISDQTFVQLQGLLPKQKRKIQTILAKIISEFDLLKNFSEKEGWIFKHQQAPAETLTNLIFQLSEWLQEYLAEQLEDANKENVQ